MRLIDMQIEIILITPNTSVNKLPTPKQTDVSCIAKKTYCAKIYLTEFKWQIVKFCDVFLPFASFNKHSDYITIVKYWFSDRYFYY